jgi:hypothetical protein
MPWKEEPSSAPKERFFTTYQKPAIRFKKKRRTNKHKEKLPKSSHQRTSKKQHDADVPTIRDMPLTRQVFFDPDSDSDDHDDADPVYGKDGQDLALDLPSLDSPVDQASEPNSPTSDSIPFASEQINSDLTFTTPDSDVLCSHPIRNDLERPSTVSSPSSDNITQFKINFPQNRALTPAALEPVTHSIGLSKEELEKLQEIHLNGSEQPHWDVEQVLSHKASRTVKHIPGQLHQWFYLKKEVRVKVQFATGQTAWLPMRAVRNQDVICQAISASISSQLAMDPSL